MAPVVTQPVELAERSRPNARSIGCVERSRGIDLYVTEALPAHAVIAVHSEGETAFDQMAKGYPAEFVNDEHSYWKELTGEDD